MRPILVRREVANNRQRCLQPFTYCGRWFWFVMETNLYRKTFAEATSQREMLKIENAYEPPGCRDKEYRERGSNDCMSGETTHRRWGFFRSTALDQLGTGPATGGSVFDCQDFFSTPSFGRILLHLRRKRTALLWFRCFNLTILSRCG